MALTKAQIIEKIKNNPDFAIGAVIDNNFSAVVNALKSEGIIVTDKNGAMMQLRILSKANKERLRRVFAKVPFIEMPGHYTSGVDVISVSEFNSRSAGCGTNCKCK